MKLGQLGALMHQSLVAAYSLRPEAVIVGMLLVEHTDDICKEHVKLVKDIHWQLLPCWSCLLTKQRTIKTRSAQPARRPGQREGIWIHAAHLSNSAGSCQSKGR